MDKSRCAAPKEYDCWDTRCLHCDYAEVSGSMQKQPSELIGLLAGLRSPDTLPTVRKLRDNLATFIWGHENNECILPDDMYADYKHDLDLLKLITG